MTTETQDATTKNLGGRPRKDITKTAEFQAAVKAAVEAATTQIVTTLAGARSEQPGAAGMGDDVISRLALSIGEIANQTSGRKIVAPEELERRAKARMRMIDVLRRVNEQGLQPEYALTSETYLNEILLKPYENGPKGEIQQTEIIWTGIPNEAMSPRNAAAQEVYEHFLQSIGGFTDLTKNANSDPYWVTRGGLTVKGRANQRRTVGTLGDGPHAPQAESTAHAFTGSLAKKTSDPRDPTAPLIHVLGTIAPPARQNTAGVDSRN